MPSVLSILVHQQSLIQQVNLSSNKMIVICNNLIAIHLATHIHSQLISLTNKNILDGYEKFSASDLGILSNSN